MIGLQNKEEDDFLPGVTKEKKQSLAIFAVPVLQNFGECCINKNAPHRNQREPMRSIAFYN